MVLCQEPKAIPAVFFETSEGIRPVIEWLKALTPAEKNRIGRNIMKVQFAWPIGKPLVDNLGDSLWEIRTQLPTNKIARVIFFMHEGQIILLHGFIKKTQKTPQQEIVLAKKRRALYLNQ